MGRDVEKNSIVDGASSVERITGQRSVG